MKIIVLGIIDGSKFPFRIKAWTESLYDLPWMAQNSVSKILKLETINFISQLIPFSELYVGQYRNNYKIAIQPFDKYFSIAISDYEYPEDKLDQLTQLIFESYSGSVNVNSELKSLLIRSQDPKRIVKLQSELEEVKKILVEDIEKIIERGENLEDLLEQTQQLNFQAKLFRSKARSLNSCCLIL